MSPPVSEPYQYPDPGDQNTIALIADSGLSETWGSQEEEILGRLDRTMTEGRARTLLDYGSGVGRLSIRYLSLFDSVTSFEPDHSRAEVFRAELSGSPLANRIRLTEDVNDIGDGFDAVVCSHVIQHVSHATADLVLHEIASRVRPGGPVLLLTTLAAGAQPRYVLSRVGDAGESIETDVSRDDFERALESPRAGILPIRFFPFELLVDEFSRSGMELETAFGFHGTCGVVGPTREVSPDLLRCRDVAVLARRRE